MPPSAEFMLLSHQSGEFELPLGYFTINGDLFNLPAGPVSFAVGRRIPWRAMEERSRRVERHVWHGERPQFRTFTGEPGRLGNLSGSAISGDQPAMELSRVRTASSSILPSARNGTAKTPLRFCPSRTCHLSRRNTRNTTHRNRNFQCAGSRLIPNGSAR